MFSLPNTFTTIIITTITTDLYNNDVDKWCYLLGCNVVAHNDGQHQLQKFRLHHLDTYVRHFLNCQQSAKKNLLL